MNAFLVELASVEVRAGRRTILDIDALQVARGEIVSILGPNGAGKSTLLKTILGLIRPQRGRVTVLGERVDRLAGLTMNRFRRRLGYVAQDLAGRSELPLTTREVVAIGRTGRAGLGRRLSREDWSMVDGWLERLGLASLGPQAYSDLSGGEQRKTLIARAMVQEPELIVLDEPTAHLDLGWREQIVSIIEQLHADLGLTVLLVCHEPEVIPSRCQRVALIEDGRVVHSDRPEAVLTDGAVRRLYGPGFAVIHEHGRHAVFPGGRTDS